MSSSNLVLARMIYSGSCQGAHAYDREPPALKECLAHASAVEGLLDGFTPFIDLTAMPCC